jgi:hypothetical protein
MSVEYTIAPNQEQLAEAIALFRFVGGNTDDAVRIAINKTAPKIRTAASRAIREQIRLKAAYVNERLVVADPRATRRNLKASIRTPTRGLLMSRFSTDPQIADPSISWIKPPPVPPGGIKVKVKPTGSAKVFQGRGIDGKPFYLVLKNSRAIGIAGRETGTGKLKVFHGPSISQVFNDVRDDVLPQAAEEYQAQILDAMRYLLTMRYPPEPVE